MDCSFVARNEVKSAKRIFTNVPFTLNRSPRKRKVSAEFVAVGETNCGRSAIKKSATFGFKTFIRIACLNIVVNDKSGNSFASWLFFLF
jgi:hypothetical protein